MVGGGGCTCLRDEGTRPEGQRGMKNVSNEPERKGTQSLTRWEGKGVELTGG